MDEKQRRDKRPETGVDKLPCDPLGIHRGGGCAWGLRSRAQRISVHTGMKFMKIRIKGMV